MHLAGQERLADLIWRSYKLKIIVLVASLLCLQLISSGLRNGRKIEEEINKRSVEARLQWTSKIPSAVPHKAVLSDPTMAGLADEAELRVYAYILPMLPSNDPKSQAVIDSLHSRYRQLQGFVGERENAYNLDFGIPYLKSSVLINVLLLMDLWPILLLCSLATVFAISMRQRAYEIVLSKIIREAGGANERAIQSAFTGYLAGELRTEVLAGKRVSVYIPSLILLPEPFITTCLFLALLYFSARMPGTNMPSMFQLSSTIVGYHTVVMCVGALLVLILFKTKSYYASEVQRATGTRVLGWLGLKTARYVRAFKSLCSRPNVRHAGTRILGITTLGSLFLPWVGNWGTFGFQLFLAQSPISQSGKLTFYRMDPTILGEVRLQLAVAIAFVMLMLFGGTFRRYAIKVRRISYYLSIAILLMIANFLIYLVVLDYTQQRELVNAVFSMMFNPAGPVEGARGLPLVLQYPMYGFFLFIFSLTSLCLVASAGASASSNADN